MHSVAFTTFVITGMTATFTGTCANNGVPCTFSVSATTMANPARMIPSPFPSPEGQQKAEPFAAATFNRNSKPRRQRAPAVAGLLKTSHSELPTPGGECYRLIPSVSLIRKKFCSPLFISHLFSASSAASVTHPLAELY